MCTGAYGGQKSVLYTPGARGVVIVSHLLEVLGTQFRSLEKVEWLCQPPKENLDGNDSP